jgi:hypothetical protein
MEDAHERHLERGLLAHIQAFPLELEQGFAFVGSQYPLTVGGPETVLSRAAWSDVKRKLNALRLHQVSGKI